MSTNVINSLADALAAKDLQIVFDTVGERLLRQGMSCVDEDGNCNYDNGKGQRCAVGLLLSDKELANVMAADFNGVSVRTIANRLGYFKGSHFEPIPNDTYHIPNLELLVRLQNVHDDNAEEDDWRETVADMLRWLASVELLNSNKIDEVMYELAA